MDAVKLRWVWVALIAALLVRIPAISSLPIDWDEPIYMDAAQSMNQALHQGDWTSFATPVLNPEHPGLVKTIYAVGFSLFGPQPSLVERLIVVRSTSLLAGLGLILMVARIHPGAGLAIALNTLHAKYSCQGYLDSLPALMMAGAMLFGWKRKDASHATPFVLCGMLWGAAMAGKWIHGLPGIILLTFIQRWRARAVVLLVALFFTWFLDPTAWLHPLDRIQVMVHHHQAYASTVSETSIWAPWLSLAGGGPSMWHPDVFPWSFDAAWLVMGLLGLAMGMRTRWGRMLCGWFFLPMLVLMVWDTRWPQHLMVVMAPLSLAVVEVLRPLLNRASHHFAPNG